LLNHELWSSGWEKSNQSDQSSNLHRIHEQV